MVLRRPLPAPAVLRLALGALVLALAPGARSAPPPLQGPGPTADDGRPNLLVLVTDDHPHDHLGCAGHPLLRTPHMDSLAARGVRFTQAFVTTPICAASRASLLTGRPERDHGYTFGQPPLAAELVRESYPARLRAAGYRVGLVGKLGVRVAAEDRATMFDTFAPGTLPYLPADGASPDEAEDGPAPRHLTERNVDRALAFLRAGGDAPFCLSVSFQAPHAEDSNPAQYLWPASCDGLYRDGDLPAFDRAAEEALFAAQPEFLRTGLNRERWHWRFETPETRERMVRGYLRLLSAVDLGVGRLLRELGDLGLADDTVVVLMGDNGYFLGERGYAGKWTMHERSIRVPLLVLDPRLPATLAGRELAAPALNVDLAPTLLDWAGVDAPEAYTGRSLRPLLEGREVPWRTEVLTEHLWDHPLIPRTRALRRDGWKVIEYLDHPEFVELYDLSSDPHERKNLARRPEHARRRDGLLARVRELVGEPGGERAEAPVGEGGGDDR